MLMWMCAIVQFFLDIDYEFFLVGVEGGGGGPRKRGSKGERK